MVVPFLEIGNTGREMFWEEKITSSFGHVKMVTVTHPIRYIWELVVWILGDEMVGSRYKSGNCLYFCNSLPQGLS